MSSSRSEQLHGEHTIIEHSLKHKGIALIPPPSADPRDPLRWPQHVKLLALVATSLFNFVGTFAASGLSVATPVLEAEFHKSTVDVQPLLSFNFLLLGLGNFIWVPLAVKFGKRSILLISMGAHTAALVWTAKASTFNSLLAARCVTGFCAASGESIVPGVVSDIFFLHERATMMSIYVLLISGSTAVGPMIASFMIGRLPDTWRDFTWLCFGLSLLSFVLIFLLYPESSYQRPQAPGPTDDIVLRDNNASKSDEEGGFGHSSIQDIMPPSEQSGGGLEIVNISWLKTWSSFISYNPSISLATAFLRPLALIALPAVVWSALVFGTALGAQVALTFASPSFLMAPPYLFTSDGIGFIQFAALIGFVMACYGGGFISDLILTRMIKKNGNTIFPEQRLVSLIPGFWVGPAGCIVVAICCSQTLSWVGVAFGYAMLSFGEVYSPNISITYVTDCFPHVASESLVAINAFKNLVAFLFLYVAVAWIQSSGWVEVYMVMFTLTSVSSLAAAALYFGRDPVHAWSNKLLRIIKVDSERMG
ncbi:hypothetical protein JX266_013026 [Neoarthrinium moseri]|nr:hypothetical protein JX266_013026 [Neoarthrinium moseri]